MQKRLSCLLHLRTIGWMTLVCATTCWGGSSQAAAESVDLKLMSFNILYSMGKADKSPPHNNWNDATDPRRERAIRIVRENMPDILGLQEPRQQQIDDLRAALPEMEFYGAGRDDGQSAGEFAAIFYRKDRFERVDQGSFWLSDTPEVPGTSFYKGEHNYPRIASWVKLQDKRSGRQIFVLNTHWEWQDAAARRQSAQLIRERLATLAKGLPVILLGDFNSPEDSPELLTVRGIEPPDLPRLADSYRDVHPERKDDERTIHDLRGKTAGSRIDFILPSTEFEATEATILRTNYDGHWPSDHYPVTATLRIQAEP